VSASPLQAARDPVIAEQAAAVPPAVGRTASQRATASSTGTLARCAGCRYPADRYRQSPTPPTWSR
jgi:hypothetical protein